MRIFACVSALAILGLALFANARYPDRFPDAPGAAGWAASPAIGDVDMGGYDIKRVDEVYCVPPTTDVAPGDLRIEPASAWNQATGTNQVGGDVLIVPGSGSKQITIDDYNNCAGDYVRIYSHIPPAAEGILSCTEGAGWTAAVSNAATATSLAACVDALAGLDAVAVAAVVYITPHRGTFLDTMTEQDATCTTLNVNGASGQVYLPGRSKLGWGDSGEFIVGDNNSSTVAFGTNLAARLTIGTAITTSSLPIQFSSRGIFDGTGTNGYFTFKNAAGTSGVTLDAAATNGRLLVRDMAGTGAGALGAVVTAKGAVTTIREADTATVTFAANPGNASKTATGLRTAKRAILGVSGRVTTTGTNCASINIGDGVDVDRYGAAIAVTSGTAFDIDDATADPREWLATAGDVVVTAVGGNCFSLVVRMSTHHMDYQADTAN